MTLVTSGTRTLGRLVVVAGVALTVACGTATTARGPSAGVAAQAPAAQAGVQQVT